MTEPEQTDLASPKQARENPDPVKVEGKTAAKPVSGSAQAERERRPSGRGPIVLAAVALIVALIALAGIGALAWSWYQLRGEQARVAQLEGRVSGLGGRLAALGNTAASERSVSALAAQLKDLQQNEAKRSAAMEQALQAVSARLAGASKSYREDEAAALMRLAQAKLDLQSDPLAAASALKLADAALAGADDPALAPVRVALAREVAALAAVPAVDAGAAYVQIDALVGRVDSLPLAGENAAAAPAAGTPAPGFSWSGIGAAFKRAFGSLIVVRHGARARPLLPPQEAWFVRENVKLALASAQLALMERDDTAWRSSLARARAWMSDWFASANPEVKNALATLDKLQALELAPPLPSLGAALAKLAALRAAASAAQ